MKSDGTCQVCGNGCEACEDSTGICKQCAPGLVLDSTGFSCVQDTTCLYKYGPVNGVQQCTNEKYSESRLLPILTDQENVDWRKWSVVNPVRDQSSCGSCWAFSAVSTVESAHAIKHGPLFEFSEQHLVSCDNSQYGCNGGWPTLSYNFYKSEGTILRSDYPYTNNEATCAASGKQRIVFTASPYAYVNVAASYAEYKKAIRNGPTGIAFGVHNDFLYYGSGIYNGPCAADVNHAMVAVGYGKDTTGQEFAIVRNSWGPRWGEQGYVRIPMGANDAYGGKCQMYQYSHYPLMA